MNSRSLGGLRLNDFLTPTAGVALGGLGDHGDVAEAVRLVGVDAVGVLPGREALQLGADLRRRRGR